MARTPQALQQVTAEQLETAVKRGRHPPKPKTELPMWWTKPTPAVGVSRYILATPLETITALLCGPDVDLGYVFTGDQDNGQITIKGLDTAHVMRDAIFALRLEHADASKLEAFVKLNHEIEALVEKRNALAKRLPKELRH